jgi:hypothetical protein
MDHDDALTVASFPALQTMGGMLRVEANPALETLEMPALTRIEAEEFDHAIRITQCESLQEAAFPALEEVVGSISLEVLDSLLAIDLSSLATVTRYISIKKAPSLTELSLDALVDVEGLVVRETSLDQCVIDELTDKLGIDCDCFDNAGSCN